MYNITLFILQFTSVFLREKTGGQQAFSVKGQTASILGFVGHLVYVVTILSPVVVHKQLSTICK